LNELNKHHKQGSTTLCCTIMDMGYEYDVVWICGNCKS